MSYNDMWTVLVVGTLAVVYCYLLSSCRQMLLSCECVWCYRFALLNHRAVQYRMLELTKCLVIDIRELRSQSFHCRVYCRHFYSLKVSRLNFLIIFE